MKKVSAKRRIWVKYGAAAVIVACIVVAIAVGYTTPPPLRAPGCAAGETAIFNKDGWWCVPARKQ